MKPLEKFLRDVKCEKYVPKVFWSIVNGEKMVKVGRDNWSRKYFSDRKANIIHEIFSVEYNCFSLPVEFRQSGSVL